MTSKGISDQARLLLSFGTRSIKRIREAMKNIVKGLVAAAALGCAANASALLITVETLDFTNLSGQAEGLKWSLAKASTQTVNLANVNDVAQVAYGTITFTS